MLRHKWEEIDPLFFSHTFVDSKSPILLANCMHPTDIDGLRGSNQYRFNMESMIEMNILFNNQMSISINRANQIIDWIQQIYKE